MNEIKALLIFEMLGRPAEHLKSTLEQFIDKISKENGVEIVNRKIYEPKRVEKTRELFTTFAETEMNFKTLNDLLKIVFTCMPSHIEIVSPEELKLKNFELNSFVNELIRKLHQYDEVAKGLIIERSILQRQLQEQGVQPAIPSQSQAQPQTRTEEKEKKKAKKKTKGIKKTGKVRKI